MYDVALEAAVGRPGRYEDMKHQLRKVPAQVKPFLRDTLLAIATTAGASAVGQNMSGWQAEALRVLPLAAA